MQFSMDLTDMLESINTVTRAISARPAKQILEGILIKTSDGRITMTCSDGNMCIETTNVAEIKEEGQTVIPGRILAELVRKLPGGKVTVSVSEERTAIVRCMKSKSSLACMNPSEYPELSPLKNGMEIKLPQNKFKNMINKVAFATATDETRQELTGSLLEISRTEARMVALDGFRLSMQKLFLPFELPDEVDKVSVILPGKVLNELGRILQDEEDFCKLYLEKGRMQAVFGNTKLSSVLIKGEFIDYRRILPTEFMTEVRANRTEIIDAIDRASLMAREGKNNLIRMNFNNNNVTISSNADMGNVTEEVEIYLSGDPIDIAFNAKYITDIIKNIDAEELVMKFRTNISPCVFVPPEGDDYLYLILPVRIFQ